MIRQRWERRPDGPGLFELQAITGVNKIVESLDGFNQARSLPRTGLVSDDLKMLFDRWQGNIPAFEISRNRVDPADRPTDEAKETSGHLARLWAYDQINSMIQQKGPDYLEQAVTTATSYQLVTPVSGAVVLETQQQYKRAGLQPVDPATVPTIPEPEVWALLIIAAIALAWVVFRERLSPRFA
jgi:hypothetical protein